MNKIYKLWHHERFHIVCCEITDADTGDLIDYSEARFTDYPEVWDWLQEDEITLPEHRVPQPIRRIFRMMETVIETEKVVIEKQDATNYIITINNDEVFVTEQQLEYIIAEGTATAIERGLV